MTLARESLAPSSLPSIPPVPHDLLLPILTANSREVMERRILPRDADQRPLETPQECYWRVAWTVAGGSYPHDLYVGSPRTEMEGSRRALALEYYDLMASGRFLPNSPALVNAGRELGQLSACYVLPVPDSIEGIFEAVKYQAMIHKSGGGTGFDFSTLRPAGSYVGSTSGIASGPVTFMLPFDAATAAIKQGGTRRGANMANLSIDHPDVWDFINLKAELGKDGVTKLENFNISVTVTDEFMEALDTRPGDMWKQSGYTAQALWDRIAQGAWTTGDPGVIFIDTINNSPSNPVKRLGPIGATNPCGEQALYDYDSCNLGSINLAMFYDPEAEEGYDREALTDTVRLAVRFLDDVISVNRYPLRQIDKTTKDIRRIGLGVMGWADLLIAMDLRYGSPESLDVAERIMCAISDDAFLESVHLAEERGPFPLFSDSVYADELPIRNSTRTTVAPTGTISIIAGCSSGVEPIFAPVFYRRHKIDHTNADAWFEMYELHPGFEALIRGLPDWTPEALNGMHNDLANEQTTITELVVDGALPEEAMLYRGANEIPWEDHVRMQAAFQRYTDNGVSKTINLPEDATVDDIKAAYRMAHSRGCKGITVYRNKCRSVQVLGGSRASEAVVEPAQRVEDDVLISTVTMSAQPAVAASLGLSAPTPVRTKLPAERQAINHKFQVGELEGYINVGLYPDGRPGEIFVNASKQGSTVNGLLDSWAILFSYGLQYGLPLSVLCDKLRAIRFEPSGMTHNRSIPTASSVVDYVVRWLAIKFLDPDVPATYDIAEPGPTVDVYPTVATIPATFFNGSGCPECGSLLVHTEGCDKCRACGYSSCG